MERGSRVDPEKLEAVLAGAGSPPDPDCMEKTQGQRALPPAVGYHHPPASSGQRLSGKAKV